MWVRPWLHMVGGRQMTMTSLGIVASQRLEDHRLTSLALRVFARISRMAAPARKSLRGGKAGT